MLSTNQKITIGIAILAVIVAGLGVWFTHKIGLTQNTTGEKANQLAEENNRKLIKYELTTNKNTLTVFDQEKTNIDFTIANKGDYSIIGDGNNGDIHTSIYLSGLDENIKIQSILESGKSEDISKEINLAKSNTVTGTIVISPRCEPNTKCVLQGIDLPISYTKISGVKILGIDASKDEKDRHGDGVDLSSIGKILRNYNVQYKTMYSSAPYRNNTIKGSKENGNIILFYNEKYSKFAPETTHLKELLLDTFKMYNSSVDLLIYNEVNFNNILRSLSDCKDTNICGPSLKFEQLSNRNLFSKQFFDNNRDIDFVFMIPYRTR